MGEWTGEKWESLVELVERERTEGRKLEVMGQSWRWPSVPPVTIDLSVFIFRCFLGVGEGVRGRKGGKKRKKKKERKERKKDTKSRYKNSRLF